MRRTFVICLISFFSIWPSVGLVPYDPPMKYRKYDVSKSVAERPEALGSKEKTWIVPSPELGLPAVPHLFKIGRPNTGENWSEKACCEILKRLRIPCAEYNFAVCLGNEGVISERFLPGRGSFVPANMIFSELDNEYDGSIRFKQARYKLVVALAIVQEAFLKPPLGAENIYPDLTAHDFFVGYLLFDALVGNTDRHHENWGVVISGQTDDQTDFHLAPTFDHASSLGRELTDEARAKRLTTPDPRATVEAYAERAHSAFYGVGQNPKPLTSRETVAALRQAAPETTIFWAKKLETIESTVFEDIFARIGPNDISNEAVEFALRVLAYNQSMIREVGLG